MRLRKVKNASTRLQNYSQYFIAEPCRYKANWKSVFSNLGPLHIEIGCGKGKFITQMALEHPNINFIGIEKYDSVLLRACEKASAYNLPNLKLIVFDALKLTDCFGIDEVDLIYLNFSDPWPKKPHAKRRLTSPEHLKIYKSILNGEGAIYQKTDNRHFFEYSLASFSYEGWYLNNICLDLHQDDPDWNITTEFEDKWSALGPIYRLEARLEKDA